MHIDWKKAEHVLSLVDLLFGEDLPPDAKAIVGAILKTDPAPSQLTAARAILETPPQGHPGT